MLQCSSYIPVTAGSAFEPGLPGTPPKLISAGLHIVGYASTPSEDFSARPTGSLPDKVLSFPPAASNHDVYHGYVQNIVWDNRFIFDSNGSRSGDDTYPAFIPTSNASSYNRWNYASNMVTKSAYNVLTGTTSTCVIDGEQYMFNITAINYAVFNSNNESYYIHDIVHIPHNMTSDDFFSASLSIGGLPIFSGSGEYPQSITYGPVFQDYTARRITNCVSGWSGSSLINPTNFYNKTTVRYNAEHDYTTPGQNYGEMSSFLTYSVNDTGIIGTDDIFKVNLNASAMGDLWKYGT